MGTSQRRRQLSSAPTSAAGIADWADTQVSAPPTADDSLRFGRPTSLTPALVERICAAFNAGNRPSVAARAVGVADRTFDRWIADGRADDEAEINSVYAYLWRSLDRKEAECELGLIADAASGRMGWQGPMTVASRRWREHWSGEDSKSAGVMIVIGGTAADRVQIDVLSPPSQLTTGEG